MNLSSEASQHGFRSYVSARRQPARAMDPIVDPAGWLANELRNVATWSYSLTEADVGELVDAVAAFKRSGKPLVDAAKGGFPLGRFAETLREMRRELLDGRGIVMMRGFPLDEFDRAETAIAYLGLGSYIGQAMSQNKQGHVLGHVKDLGGDYDDPKTRGYLTNAEMRFHSDGCDYVGLLCLQTSRSGGESRIASSVTVYNRMLAQRPDLVKALTEDFYRSRSGEINPGELPYFKQPIFSFHEGYFSAIGVGAVIDKAQKLPGVPPFTTAQKEAVALYRQTVEECALDIGFQRGDVQFLNNWVMLHTRRGYEDWADPERKRHLLRLWLNDPEGRAVPPDQRETRTGRGVRIEGVELVAPLDV
ncbi:MAG TPA: TauD/TfdA family dioxygenase [Alphaproteobacteria bacterium]|nr:TauD/TfdA family dioxygenase [Alphaproteobacteria bacterium]